MNERGEGDLSDYPFTGLKFGLQIFYNIFLVHFEGYYASERSDRARRFVHFYLSKCCTLGPSRAYTFVAFFSQYLLYIFLCALFQIFRWEDQIERGGGRVPQPGSRPLDVAFFFRVEMKKSNCDTGPVS